MTYQDNPNRRNRGDTSYTGWIIGGLVALAVVIGLFMMFGRDTNTASNAGTNTNRPAATAPATTTGTATPATAPTGSAR
jgi:hypothetical protein